MHKIKSIGSRETAQALAKKAVEKIPAYQKFLAKEGKTGKEPFEELPLTSKKTYMTQYPYIELLPMPVSDNVAIFASSGSSGKKPFYWVYEKNQLLDKRIQPTLEALFSIHKKKSLFIIALALGSWVGGDTTSFIGKTIALNAPYPLTVITPAINIDEIIMLINNFGVHYEQIVLYTSPTTFAHLMLTCDHEKANLPFEKMRYMFFEEGFTEDFRIAVEKRSKASETNPVAFSLFASADTGLLGVESQATVAIRKLCYHNHDFAAHIGAGLDFPLFFHLMKSDTYIEQIDDELCITAWQGIPLIRYNLNDRMHLHPWAKMQETVKNFKFNTPLEQQLAAMVIHAPAQLPDLFAVFGRADSCINIGGTKIYENMLDDVMRSEELSPYLTGMYKAKLATQEFHSYIDFVVELKEGVKHDHKTIDIIEDLIEEKLAEMNPEFRGDYEKLFKKRKMMSGLKSVKVKTVPWPTISHELETKIKVRGIIPNS